MWPWKGLLILAEVFAVQALPWPDHHASQPYSLSINTTSSYGIQVTSRQGVVVSNNAIIVGNSNDSVTPVQASPSGELSSGNGQITANFIQPNVVKVEVDTKDEFVGARFYNSEGNHSYGVWEYPWFGGLSNENVSFDLKGVGFTDGVNWDNARAPFFFNSAGYGVYADTLDMGSFDFSTPDQSQFIFNTSSLTYYIVLPRTPGDFKSIIQTYTGLSARIDMPPDSGYGPTFWSDNFEQDFHQGVSNAQENYYDVINHLFNNKIHATSMFADRPYGTGNGSFGNFDFDPVYYPTPEQFIANLSTWGFDFQVWAANRAFLDTELFNVSTENGWLFPGYDPEFFLGPALNLSIPEAYDYFKQRLSYFPSIGVKGYKIDRGEEDEMPVYEQNIQMTLFEQICYETMVEKWGDSDYYNFARSIVDRSRQQTYVWNGDAHSNFSGLAYSVASGIRAGLIGFPVWGSDTGGYVRELNDPSEELWARWMHFSTFSPVYELMLGTNHTPWYPPYSSDLVTIVKETANLHHDLLPFIKSYTYHASKTGLPLIRALFLETPSDNATYTIADEYFFGSEFLVAPIVDAGGTRSVYFPVGCSYLEYYNKTAVYQGGSTESVSMNLHYAPVYVRAGAIIPRGDILQANNKWTADWKPELTIEVYPSFDIPISVFSYYNGFAEREAQIRLQTIRKGCVVILTYGNVGVDGKIVFYTKTGQRTEPLNAQGGSVVLRDLESLFEDPVTIGFRSNVELPGK